jgi:lipopolysaccharide transport system permease protein
MLIFLTPVIYPTSIMRPSLRFLISLNPVAGAIEALRAVIGGGQMVNWDTLIISAISSVAIFLIGLYYFRSTERLFADIV